MNFIILFVFSILIFLATLIGGEKYHNTTLYALAIGGAVNANFFHAGNYPIDCFSLPFGIDSIIYTLFVYCVILMFIKENLKSASLLAISSVVAIMFSAVMQLLADILSIGNTVSAWLTFTNFLVSALASIIAIAVVLYIINKLKGKINNYLLILIGIFLATLINSLLYYPITLLIHGMPDNISLQLLTSIIGKMIAMGSCILAYFVLTKKQNNLLNKK